MQPKSKRLNWDRLALITGLLGFLLEFLAFVLPAFQGNKAHALALEGLGVIGILFWAGWVTVSLMRLNGLGRAPTKYQEIPTAVQLDNYTAEKVFFDSSGRSFINELRFGHGSDSKGTEMEKVDLAKTVQDGNQLRIKRLQPRFRWIITVAKYQPGLFTVPAEVGYLRTFLTGWRDWEA